MYALFFVCANVLSIKNKFFFAFFAILPKINILEMKKMQNYFVLYVWARSACKKNGQLMLINCPSFIIKLRLHVHAAVHLEYLARDVG